MVRVLGSGEAAIMARYQGHVTTFRAVVPFAAKTPDWSFAEKTLVDKFTARKWKDPRQPKPGMAMCTRFVLLILGIADS